MSKPPSKDDRLVQGWLRPLSMPSIGILPFEEPVDRIDAAELVRDLCWNEPGEAILDNLGKFEDEIF